MFSDEDLFTISVAAESKEVRAQNVACQTKELELNEQGTSTLQEMTSVEVGLFD